MLTCWPCKNWSLGKSPNQWASPTGEGEKFHHNCSAFVDQITVMSKIFPLSSRNHISKESQNYQQALVQYNQAVAHYDEALEQYNQAMEQYNTTEYHLYGEVGGSSYDVDDNNQEDEFGPDDVLQDAELHESEAVLAVPVSPRVFAQRHFHLQISTDEQPSRPASVTPENRVLLPPTPPHRSETDGKHKVVKPLTPPRRGLNVRLPWRTAKAYAPMLDDDYDDDSSAASRDHPPMMEVTIDNHEATEHLHVHNSADRHLLDEWNDLFDIDRRLPPSSTSDEDSEPDQAAWNEDAPSFDEQDNATENDDDDASANSHQTPESTEEKRKSQTLRRQRNRRRRRGGGSVSSTPSLLSFTIEEETAEDLQDSTGESGSAGSASKDRRTTLHRSLSTPNMAAVRTSPVRVASEDPSMDGILNSHHITVSLRSPDDNETSSTKDERSHADDSSQSRARSLSPLRIWQVDRETRGAMHTNYVSSSDSSNDERSTASERKNKARLARIQRLRQQNEGSRDVTPTRKGRSSSLLERTTPIRRGRTMSPSAMSAARSTPSSIHEDDTLAPRRLDPTMVEHDSLGLDPTMVEHDSLGLDPTMVEQDSPASPEDNHEETGSTSTPEQTQLEASGPPKALESTGGPLPVRSLSASPRARSTSGSPTTVTSDGNYIAPLQTQILKHKLMSSPNRRSRTVSPVRSDLSCSTTSSAGHAESIGNDEMESFLLDNLDVSMAKLLRKEGEEYGEDENSI